MTAPPLVWLLTPAQEIAAAHLAKAQYARRQELPPLPKYKDAPSLPSFSPPTSTTADSTRRLAKLDTTRDKRRVKKAAAAADDEEEQGGESPPPPPKKVAGKKRRVAASSLPPPSSSESDAAEEQEQEEESKKKKQRIAAPRTAAESAKATSYKAWTLFFANPLRYPTAPSLPISPTSFAKAQRVGEAGGAEYRASKAAADSQ